MRRRSFLLGSGVALALPHVARGERASVLKYVPGADLPSSDPIWVPSYTTRTHGVMVFDTLYGEAGAAKGFAAERQMVAGHTVDEDDKTWPLTLRRTVARARLHRQRNYPNRMCQLYSPLRLSSVSLKTLSHVRLQERKSR